MITLANFYQFVKNSSPVDDMMLRMKILGIETSCDETAAAVVEDGYKLLSNVVASSADQHRAYGGVVPEIAARSHIESINPVIHQALYEAKYRQGFGLDGVQGSKEKRANRTNGTLSESRTKMTQQSAKSAGGVSGSARKQAGTADDLWDDIDGIAVTYGPGLGGSLLVGVLAAKTLAILYDKPLYAVNHVEAHAYAAFLDEDDARPDFPILSLIVSGGHTQLVLFKNHGKYQVLGRTSDDAAGEAYDKVAKMLGLPYPGGPNIEKLAEKGDPKKFVFPKARLKNKYGFSYSGLKTAVLRTAQAVIGEDYGFPSHKLAERLTDTQKADIAAGFSRIAIEILVGKTVSAYDEFAPKSVVVAGGVSASPQLRRQMNQRLPIKPTFLDARLCTDNGAMIAARGYFLAKSGEMVNPKKLDMVPNLSM